MDPSLKLEMATKSDKHILIIMVAGIGDLIMASKSFRAMRNAFPDAHLHLLTSSEAAPIAANYPYLDHVWSLPIRELRKEKSRILDMFKTILRLRKIRFDIAVNLYRVMSWPGALRMGLLFHLLKANTKVGHDAKGFGIFLHKKAPANIFQNRHFVDAMMDIALLAGGVPDNDGIEVFWDQGVEKKWEPLFQNDKLSRRARIGINPGADRPEKRWDPQHFASVADRLNEKLGARIFILGGPGEESIASSIQGAMKHPATSLAGKLTLDELAYVLSRLDLLITNDSGPMHIAAAVKTRIVALFGPEDPVYTRPYTSPDKYRIVQRRVPCRPCNREKCKNPICMEMVEPEEVLKACLELLNWH
jgi:lipopolysaccharide heptosyltransferase II